MNIMSTSRCSLSLAFAGIILNAHPKKTSSGSRDDPMGVYPGVLQELKTASPAFWKGSQGGHTHVQKGSQGN